MKTLISWIAQKNDFHADQAAEDSPNLNLHQYYYKDHDRHILLSSLSAQAGDHPDLQARAEYRKALNLRDAILKSKPGHRVDLRFLDIGDVIDLNEIFGKVEQVMVEIQDDEIDIFFSPGTSMMQVAWFLFHIDDNYHTRLIQGKKKEFNDGKVPAFIETKVDQSLTRRNLVVKNTILDRREGGWDQPLVTPTLEKVYQDARQIAAVDRIPCLISGPSGAGKEVLAHFVLQQSPRSDKAFIKVNSGALPDSLLHSLLFGHRKGAFTGADRDHKGYFEEADKGTIFLDEIGDIGPVMQLSLLRLLQQGEIQPLGAASPRKVDVRVIAATHADLKQRCRDGQFRWDLYYRLARTRLHLPGLKERSAEEVMILIDFFLRKFALEFRKPVLKLDAGARTVVAEYSWPGNVRELENLVINLYVFCTGTVKREDVLQALDDAGEPESFNLETRLLQHIRSVYRYCNGNVKRTADLLGISRGTLYKHLKVLGLASEKESTD